MSSRVSAMLFVSDSVLSHVCIYMLLFLPRRLSETDISSKCKTYLVNPHN